MIKYKIIEITPETHCIVVRFYTDKLSEMDLAIDVLDGVIRRCSTDFNIELPVPPPTGINLHNYIVARAPVQFFAIRESVKDPEADTTMDSIADRLGIEVNIGPDEYYNSVNTPNERDRYKSLIRSVVLEMTKEATP